MILLFDDIAASFGEVMEVDNPGFDGSLNNIGGALILSKNLEEINGTIQVKVGEKLCQVKVLEDHNRAIFFSNFQDGKSAHSESDEDGDEDLIGDGISDTLSVASLSDSPDRNQGEGDVDIGNDGDPSGFGQPVVFSNNSGERVPESMMGKSERVGGQTGNQPAQVRVSSDAQREKALSGEARNVNTNVVSDKFGNPKKGLDFYGTNRSRTGGSESFSFSLGSKDDLQVKIFGKQIGVVFEGSIGGC